MKHNETKLQIATADYLRGEIRHGRNVIKITKPFPELRFHHSANEGRDEAEGAKFKRMGVMPGITDWLFWGPNKWHAFCELKVGDGRLSPNQKTVKQWVCEFGFTHVVCYSIAEMRDFLIGCGWKCYNTAVIEPDYRTQQEKYKQIHDFYRPKS